jgi:hypothetical protein
MKCDEVNRELKDAIEILASYLGSLKLLEQVQNFLDHCLYVHDLIKNQKLSELTKEGGICNNCNH